MADPSPVKPKRCAIYMDGFNTYYGVLKPYPALKWLNIQSYFEALVSDGCEVEKVKYFTAFIVGDSKNGEEKADRQKRYIMALKSLPKIQVVLGHFQNKEVNCGVCYEPYKYPQEKKTDVNIAMHMMIDAFEETYDSMILVSGDSDLHPVCQWIKSKKPNIHLGVLIPATEKEQPYRRADGLTKMAVKWGFLPIDLLSKHQFPDTVKTKIGDIIRPAEWSHPSKGR